MASWHDIINEINKIGSNYDVLRRKYLLELSQLTGRNLVIYYSGWLQKPNSSIIGINDEDKNGFMTVFYQLDKSKGLDLFLHTPGGDTAATESIVDYIHSMYGNDLRVFVPQLAMSAGTMIACSAKEIYMGKHSSLGPIDPQFGGVPASGVLEEYKSAISEIAQNQCSIPLWQTIFSKYHPTLLGECDKVMKWSSDIVSEWLKRNMFENEPDKDKIVASIVSELLDHSETKSHARHLSAQKCKEIGLKIKDLEAENILQEAVLTVHHITMQTLSATPAVKIIENQNGAAFIKLDKQIMIAN